MSDMDSRGGDSRGGGRDNGESRGGGGGRRPFFRRRKTCPFSGDNAPKIDYMAQTEEYYQALKLLKVDTAMVRIPDEYHGAAGRHMSNVLRRILYVRGWFDKYKKEATEEE